MRKALLIFLFLSSSAWCALAEDTLNPEIEKHFVLLLSTKNYVLAKKTAEEASKHLKIRLNLRGLSENKKTGLTFDKKTCLDGPMQEYPCYFHRGKFDDGEYISVEYSSDYREMKPGFFIVVAYSGDKQTAKAVLDQARTVYKDAYQKAVKIYMAGE